VKVLGEDLVLFRIVQAVEVFHDSR
jgi:hypothetical protein